MRKIAHILLAGMFLFLLQNCSDDELEIFEENTELTEEFNGKSRSGDEGPMFEGCEIEYTFNNPYLTPAEKAVIRNSYGFVISYIVVDYDTEIWYVDCINYYDYNNLNPGCDFDGCYTIQSCPRDGCGSGGTRPKDPIEDPFDDDE
ncbi:hypothetical protein [uncultured Aquimarina sp.]|uniref:hypothetical protein n=1 Tax=uncultured Aquimarina sp. TaxID=575652 RepID=UPI00261D045B|nr:hypothetical protein [uncultured Aquimarina sp.]